ncbi:MAG: amidophosphoribosyltransferase [Elusimicrobiales bacterium]
MCGIFAIANHKDSARLAHLGLFSLQHRGQESAGIVVDNGGKLSACVGMGLVANVFSDEILAHMPGTGAVGHVRYSTAGASMIKNAQPLLYSHIHGQVSIAHNGTLTNALALRRELEKKGAIFQSSTDSEIIVHLMAREKGPLENAVVKSLPKLCGSYSFIFLAPGKIIAARDPLGFRPLVLGRAGKSYILASETPAIETAGGKIVREIEPGEVISISGGVCKTVHRFKSPGKTAICIFERIYFARPDAIVEGKSIQSCRYDMGRRLAREMKGIKADMVVPVPDSGTHAAFGFSKESGIPLKMALMRNHYMGRSFINFTQSIRELTVRLKLSPITDLVKGKDIILCDDSIVRGTTSRKIVAGLRRAGARKIYMAISSPPIISPCYYGIDTPTKEELIANRMNVEETRRYLGADGLHYLSEASLLEAAGGTENVFCTACFTGKYPAKNPDFA